MSVETLAVVLNRSKAVGTDKVVLLGIANHDGDGGAWPSIATLARYANVSERSVQRSIDHLIELGELRVEIGAGGPADLRADRRPNRYTVLVDNPHHGVTSTSPRRDSRGDADDGHGVTPTSPEPSLEPSISQPPSDEGVTRTPATQGEDVDNRDVRRHPHWPNVLVAVTALAHDNDLDRNELLALIAAHAPTDPWTGYLAVKHQVYVVGLGDARDATKVLSHRLADMNLARPVDADKCSAHLLPHPCPGCAADRKAVSANLPRSNPGGSPVHPETALSAPGAVSAPPSTRQSTVSVTGGGR